MTRATVRALKRAMRDGAREDAGEELRQLAQQSALDLLTRSVAVGHGRLALLRLAAAVEVGACVPPEHWFHCTRVAHAGSDPKLQQLLRSAARRAGREQIAGDGEGIRDHHGWSTAP